MSQRKGNKGFTLIELMIVIAIISVLAAILIPQLLRGKQSADEKAVMSTVKTFSTMQTLFSGDKGRFGTIQELSDGDYLALGATLTAGQYDQDQCSFKKAGYDFTYTRVNDYEWNITAVPEVWGKTGTINYFIDQSNVVRYNEVDQQVPSVLDPVLK